MDWVLNKDASSLLSQDDEEMINSSPSGVRVLAEYSKGEGMGGSEEERLASSSCHIVASYCRGGGGPCGSGVASVSVSVIVV